MPQSFAEQLRSLPMSPNLGQSLERAHRSARDQSHRVVTLEHLLLALTEDTEAALILQSANIDLGRLSTDASGYLGGLLDDMRAEPGTEPRPDAELLRVLQAAASAAQQSRRKQIDGAIVLAAIVGDGKSPAAGLLKALGMTFEEAIRALQRANTKARLKPLAKPSEPPPAGTADATQAASAPAAVPPSTSEPAQAAETQGVASPEAPRPETPAPGVPLAAQSADEILAAARSRIQQRAAAAVAKTEPAAARRAPPREAELRDSAALDINPEMGAIDPGQTKSLTAAIEAAMASSGSRGAAASPSPTLSSRPEPSAANAIDKRAPALATSPTRPAWIPPAEPAMPAARAPQSPLARAPPAPLPARPVKPGEGPRRPPLPQLVGPPGQAPPNFANRQPHPAPHAPWPQGGEPGARPPLANGSLAEAHAPLAHVGGRPDVASKAPMPGPRGTAPGERALLAESIPRRMRVGEPAAAEVRIARAKIDNLIAALNARAAQHGDAAVARLLTVRLGAPQGGFLIEPAGPEGHWIDGAAAAAPGSGQDEFISWNWNIVPQRRGRKRLTLLVTAQAVGRDGGMSQSALPERAIEVRVGANKGRRIMRLFGWMTMLVAGVLIGRYWQELMAQAFVNFNKVLGMLAG